ncbi:Acidic juvenile hormone-suppressible protein 1 [Eumeta japonica]|uniref:Acidic juvenile hormone-suppressible protein 1 n=1 Tax=Eumeta variegata TaxID=151549 RepID=A0A4C1V1A1_EUMVA|nr:Acidic juvenile hormone-suppressible protein 1 [Eumeta japonica]
MGWSCADEELPKTNVINVVKLSETESLGPLPPTSFGYKSKMRERRLATMARLLVLFCCSLLACCLAEQAKPNLPYKVANKTWAEHQIKLMDLFYRIREPLRTKEYVNVASTWNIEKNIANYNNVTAVKLFKSVYEYGMLERGVPFSVLEPSHLFQAKSLFHVLYSAKDYDTFYKTAVWARDRVNEGLFVYVLSVAILHRKDTEGIVIPPIYEVFPFFFNNAQIMNTVERINVHQTRFVNHYHHTYLKKGDTVVVRSNYTLWPYVNSEERLLHYLTHDHGFNAFYYYRHLVNPFWLGKDVVQLSKDRRGEWLLFFHKQLLARYYMERLSNGLGEIPDLTYVTPVKEGFDSGLIELNGIPLPDRPDNLNLMVPENDEMLHRITEFENRLRSAIDEGFITNHLGEHISLRTPEAIDVLGNAIEANVDSPDLQFYRDFISIWKKLLGHSKDHHHYIRDLTLAVPSPLEHFQTALRDPAFYMIWKRIFNLVKLYHEHLPLYKPEELALHSVQIMKKKSTHNHTYVLVERPRLNHKPYKVRVTVNSDISQTVVVRFFLAPKYDGAGHEIPLQKNYLNFMLLDQFKYNLIRGENKIVRDSSENVWTIDDWTPAHEIHSNAQSVLQGYSKATLDMSQRVDGMPTRLVLPKGHVDGMPYTLMVFISEYRAPRVPFGTGFDPVISLGLGSGARFMSDEPMGYPMNRPVYDWQIHELKNFHSVDVLIYHKHTEGLVVAHKE